jgi:hypothetical protein
MTNESKPDGQDPRLGELGAIENKLRSEVGQYPPDKLTLAARWIEKTQEIKRAGGNAA